MSDYIYIFESTPVDSSGVAKTVNFSRGLMTEDELGTTPYPVRLIQAFTHETTIFESNMPGNTTVSVGSSTVNNTDGRFDFLLDYKWDSRPVTIKRGKRGDAYSSFTTEFVGSVLDISADSGTIVFTLRDNSYKLLKPLQANKYTGAGGSEGSLDLRNKTKPLLFGKARNLSPVWVSTPYLIAQFNDGAAASVQSVYDKANPLTFFADYATYALLQAAKIPSGSYATCLAQGFIRLGAPPAGTLTMDATGFHGSVANLPELAKQVLLVQGGLTTGDLNVPSFTQASADVPHAFEGLFFQEPEFQFDEFLETISSAINGYWYVSKTGLITIGQFKFRTPVATIRQEDLVSLSRQSSPPPLHRVKVNYAKNATIQGPSDFTIPREGLNGWLKDETVYVVTDAAGAGGSYTYVGEFEVYLNDVKVNSLDTVQFSEVVDAPWLTLAADGTFTISNPGTDVASASLEARMGEFYIRETFSLRKAKGAGLGRMDMATDRRRFTFSETGALAPAGQTATITANGVNTTTLTWSAVDNLGNAVNMTGTGGSRTIAGTDIVNSPLVSWIRVTATDTNAVQDSVKIVVQQGEDALAAGVLGALSAANATIDIYYNDNPPSGAKIDDLWFDTNDSNKLYRWSGSAWVLVADSRIAQALTDAATAQGTADGKIKTFFTTSTPTGTAVGDLWINPNTGIVLRWNGSSWADSFASRNIPRGVWSGASVVYNIYDTVYYNGVIYTATALHTSSAGSPPSSGGNWQKYSASNLTELDSAAKALLDVAYAGIVAIADDQIITADEKVQILRPMVEDLESQYFDVVARLNALGLTSQSTTLTDVRTALFSLLNVYIPAWNSPAGDTRIYSPSMPNDADFSTWLATDSSFSNVNGFIRLTDASANFGAFTRSKSRDSGVFTYCVGLTVKKTTGTVQNSMLRGEWQGGATPRVCDLTFNTTTGLVLGNSGSANWVDFGVWDIGSEWFVFGAFTAPGDSNLIVQQIYPAIGPSGGSGYVNTTTGSIDISSAYLTPGGWVQMGRASLVFRLREYQRVLTASLRVISEKQTNPRGAWSGSSVAYAVNDMVGYNGVLYIALVAHTSSAGNPPSISSNWQKYSASSLGELDTTAFNSLSAATTALAAAVNDNIMTVAEKQTFLRPTHRALEAEYQSLVARASALGISTTALADLRFWWNYAADVAQWNRDIDVTTYTEHSFGSTPAVHATRPTGWSSVGNITLASDYLGDSAYQSLGDNGSAADTFQYVDMDIPTTPTQYTFGITIKKDTVPSSTRFPLFQLATVAGGITKGGYVCVDTSTGLIVNQDSAALDGYAVWGGDEEWYIALVMTTNSGNTRLRTRIDPAWGVNVSYNAAAQGSIGIRRTQLSGGTFPYGSYPGQGGAMMINLLKSYQREMKAVAKKISELDSSSRYEIDAQTSYTFPYTSAGVSINLPQNITARLKDSAGNTITTGVTWNVFMVSGSYNGATEGVEYGVSGVNSGSAYATLSSIQNNTVVVEWRARIGSLMWTKRITLVKEFQAPPPPTGGGGGNGSTLPVSASFNLTVSTTTPTDASGVITATMPSSKSSVNLTLTGNTDATGASPASSSWRFQRRTSTGPDVWTDVGTATSANARILGGEYVSGSINLSTTDSGLTGGSTYSWRVVGNMSSGSNPSTGYGDLGITAP